MRATTHRHPKWLFHRHQPNAATRASTSAVGMSVPRQAIPQVLAGPQQFVLADSLSGHGIPKEARFCGEFRQRMLPGLSSCRPFPDCTEDVPVLCCEVHPGHSWNGVSCGQPFRTVDAPGIRYRLGWKGRTNNTMPRLPALHVCGSSSFSGVFDLQSTSVPTRVSIREANPHTASAWNVAIGLDEQQLPGPK